MLSFSLARSLESKWNYAFCGMLRRGKTMSTWHSPADLHMFHSSSGTFRKLVALELINREQ